MPFKGAVACGHPETAAAVTAILEEGGNAFDAALAGLCMACVAEPALTSLGGGGFLLARPTTAGGGGPPRVFDFFAQTPVRRRTEPPLDFRPVYAEFGDARQEFHIGLGAVATPGLVRGLFAVHADLGLMPMTAIVAPAARLAREGCVVGRIPAMLFSLVAAILGSSPETLALYGSRERPGELAGEGEVIVQPALADALETLAVEGEDLFYRGEIAAAVIADCRNRGGHLQAEDFARYAVIRRRPLIIEAFGTRLHLNPPPASGGILIAFALEMLRDAGLQALGPASPATVERLVRTMIATGRMRSEVALHALEPDGAAATVLAPALIRRYRRWVAGAPAATRGTTHISVVDAAGNAASLSLSNGAGSGYVAPGTGIHFNNMLGEADLHPGGLDAWPCDRRMSSMMAPTFALNREAAIVLGSGGSNRIRSAILQVLLNLLVFRMPPEVAVTAPRFHVENNRLSLEPGLPEAAVAAAGALVDAVEAFSEPGPFFGGVHAVRLAADGSVEGAGDPRRGGVWAVA